MTVFPPSLVAGTLVWTSLGGILGSVYSPTRGGGRRQVPCLCGRSREDTSRSRKRHHVSSVQFRAC